MQERKDDVTILKVYQLMLSLTNDVNNKFKRLEEINANVERIVNRMDMVEDAFPPDPTGGNKFEQHRANIIAWRQRDKDSQADRKSLWIHIRNWTAGTAMAVFLVGMWEYLKISVKR